MTETGNMDRILPEWEENMKAIKIPACFSKMPQESGKEFPHTKQVGTYLVGRMINKGSFAKVMEGMHVPTGEKVAIKVIDKRKAKQDSYVLKNMKREPRIHQMIKHPNVVQLYETLETDNSYYMVMELCLGGDLLDRICDKQRLAEREVRRYTWQILSAVEYLHCHGIVHRGVSMFAMLTGTLPFTVEPFNIKQLHQKMVIGEISPIPPDISPGAVQFMQSLLEPDPVKRPGVKEAMKDKWLNEGFTKKILNATTSENRLCLSELNPVVLNYMTEMMEFSLSEVIQILRNNKPSSAMASYCLLLKKLLRYQKAHRRTQRESTIEKHNINSNKHVNEESEIPISQQAEMDTLENLRNNHSKTFPSVVTLAVPDAIQQDETVITSENQEQLTKAKANLTYPIFYLVSKFADRELVHLGPPTSSSKSTLREPTYQPLLVFQENLKDFEDLAEVRKSCLQEKSQTTVTNNQPPSSNIQAMTSTSKVPPQSLMENRTITKSPLPQQDIRFKDLLKAVDDNISMPIQWHPGKEGTNLLMTVSPQISPLPRLQQTALRETKARKLSRLGRSQHTNICPLILVNGSKPPAFPMSHEQMLTVRSMKQSKEKTTYCCNKKAKKNLNQLRHTSKTTDLSLPALYPPCQARLGEKAEILKLNFA
ncbi:hypothetical protein ASZ78_003791 [Callipepla squamata]|uniref:non-specific serine/threonine protein kinase n=1 Tax=Callipepla squamata TaxID=9009 RepID=A0A226N189_CALSU|nr:hypothetical protein ASZ78_003791 [Callipepla squamata]